MKCPGVQPCPTGLCSCAGPSVFRLKSRTGHESGVVFTGKQTEQGGEC